MTPGKVKRKERRARSREARRLLAALGIDPKELGRRIHVSWRTIYRWWHGGAIPHHKGMRALQKFAVRRGVRLNGKNGRSGNGNGKGKNGGDRK